MILKRMDFYFALTPHPELMPRFALTSCFTVTPNREMLSPQTPSRHVMSSQVPRSQLLDRQVSSRQPDAALLSSWRFAVRTDAFGTITRTWFEPCAPDSAPATEPSDHLPASMPKAAPALENLPTFTPVATTDTPTAALTPGAATDTDADADIPEYVSAIAAALRSWSSGDADAFSSLRLHPAASAFAADIRQALIGVHSGELITYAELAARAGHPRAIRAAASACARNPLPLIVPCHRVIPAATAQAADRGQAERSHHRGQAQHYGNYAFGAALKTALIHWEQAMLKP